MDTVDKLLPNCCKNTAKLLLNCGQTAAKLLPNCCQIVSKLFPNCYPILSGWSKIGWAKNWSIVNSFWSCQRSICKRWRINWAFCSLIHNLGIFLRSSNCVDSVAGRQDKLWKDDINQEKSSTVPKNI